MKQKRKKRPFINFYGIIVALLAITRFAYTSLAHDANSADKMTLSDPLALSGPVVADYLSPFNSAGIPHPIVSVPNYDTCFPDSNHVQLQAARRWGVAPVANRLEAEARKTDLVYMGTSPFYHVDPLQQSIPYLVPRAAILLQDLGQAFYDSLHVKGLPFQQFIVTSVLRTRADVSRLRKCNGNATENSCHLFGTTFDISYTRYTPLRVPGESRRWAVRDDTLKYILSEVLNDARQKGRCYIKYEKKQKCFHITVR